MNDCAIHYIFWFCFDLYTKNTNAFIQMVHSYVRLARLKYTLITREHDLQMQRQYAIIRDTYTWASSTSSLTRIDVKPDESMTSTPIR